MGTISVDPNNINFDDANFYGDDSKPIIHVPLLAWRNKPEQLEVFKKEIRKKIMPVAWNSTI